MPAKPEVHERPDFRHQEETPLREWRPRQRGGDGSYAGSNVELGTPETVVRDLLGKLLDFDDLLEFSAEVNYKYRVAARRRILAEGRLLRYLDALPDEAEDKKFDKSAASREGYLKMHVADLRAEEKESKIAWDLCVKAVNIHQAEMDGLRSIGAKVKAQQSDSDFRYDSDRRAAAGRAGKRMEGH